MNAILPAQLPEPVALATHDMIYALANDHWNDLVDEQRDLIASLYFQRPQRITTEQALAVTQLYGAVVGVRT